MIDLQTDLNGWFALATPTDWSARVAVQSEIFRALVAGKDTVRLRSEYSDLPLPNLLVYGVKILVDPAPAEERPASEFPPPVVRIPDDSEIAPRASIERDVAALSRFKGGGDWKDAGMHILHDISAKAASPGEKLHLLQDGSARLVDDCDDRQLELTPIRLRIFRDHDLYRWVQVGNGDQEMLAKTRPHCDLLEPSCCIGALQRVQAYDEAAPRAAKNCSHSSGVKASRLASTPAGR